jgi:hypothetical protein
MQEKQTQQQQMQQQQTFTSSAAATDAAAADSADAACYSSSAVSYSRCGHCLVMTRLQTYMYPAGSTLCCSTAVLRQTTCVAGYLKL